MNTLIRRKPIILVDYFDTLMFRYIHSSQLLRPWARAMNRKYPDVNEEAFITLRKKYRTSNECAVAYSNVITNIFNEIGDKLNCSLEAFYDISLHIEIGLDLVTQYPNRRIVKKLKEAKERGKKIYLVTDFYLPTYAYKEFLKFYDLDTLFDGIYCSSDIGKTKSAGNLFEYVLSDLGCASSDCVMIGDSKLSDVENPRRIGINGIHYFPIGHKIITNIRKIAKVDFANVASKFIFRRSFRNTLFAEYGLNMFSFSRKLRIELDKDDIRSVCFLSRGGYFLKKVFDQYQKYNCDKTIITEYIYNSRKVNYEALEDKGKRELFLEYMSPFIENNEFVFVDEGWYGHGQDALHKFTHWNIKGYYLGLLRNEPIDNDSRKGVLFGVNSQGKKTPYFGVYRTNLTFYEQILSAPHGSVIGYERKSDTVVPITVWKDVEEILYEKYTKPLQDKMLSNELGMIAWGGNCLIMSLQNICLKRFCLQTIIGLIFYESMIRAITIIFAHHRKRNSEDLKILKLNWGIFS